MLGGVYHICSLQTEIPIVLANSGCFDQSTAVDSSGTCRLFPDDHLITLARPAKKSNWRDFWKALREQKDVAMKSKLTLCLAIVSALFGTQMTIVAKAIAAEARAPLGRKLELSRRPNGTPRFTVQHVLAPQPVFAITLALPGNQLLAEREGSIAPSFWAIVDKQTMTALSIWKPTGVTGRFTADSSVAMSLSVDPAQVSIVLRSLKKSVLIFAFNSTGVPFANAHIDLASLCISNPGQFVNLDTMALGCK